MSDSSTSSLATFFSRHSRLFVLTGAGMSTDSGIPDYRDEQGAWKRSPPMTHQTFMHSDIARRRYWARSLVGFQALSEARPGRGHYALAALERAGRIEQLVTQNVDGLHQRAGSRRVIDLHGQADVVRCMRCGATQMRHAVHAALARLNPQWTGLEASVGPDGDADLVHDDFGDFALLSCARCGDGIFKPDVVFFGDSVPRPRVDAAFAALERADAMLVVGSSLMVYSGYRFARRAAELGKPMACINVGRTRADDLFSLKVEASAGETLEAALQNMTATTADGVTSQAPVAGVWPSSGVRP
ncbi:NAD-dependent protein deacetylase [Chromohalobacter sarecensis]|uniref:protein acetyllysine N-acetyltransferase n=1 Tax=Chromohalobacter sarecensis TaxID=245294 RepID=A0ABV9D308_9GAMM|nr:NAD-dependent protein deacetylase [Chromohalobacter sarecensis]MCK0715269.1 NAD-dependent protein deacetylase [Chromohalobacter sarecensis]